MGEARPDTQSSDARGPAAALDLLNHIADPFYLLDDQWRFVFANRSALGYLGKGHDELIGKVLWTVFPMARGTDFETSFHLAKETGAPVQFEAQSPLTGKWVDVNANPSRWGLAVFFRDITDRKRFEQERTAALNRAEEERRALQTLNQISQRIVSQRELKPLIQSVTESATVFLRARFGAFFFNDAAPGSAPYVICGNLPSDSADADLFRELYQSIPKPPDRAVVRGDRSDAMRENAPKFPGGNFIASYLGASVISRSGEMLGWLCFGHSDPRFFTEQHERFIEGVAAQTAIGIDHARLYAALSESEARFRLMANTIPQLAWMARADGSIFWFNQRWYDYTGAAPQQVEEWGWASVLDPADIPRVINGYKLSIAAGEPWEDTFPLRRHDGEYRWHLSRAVLLRDGSGRPLIWFGTCTDVTEQRQTAEERRQLLESERAARGEAERASRLKDDFLATLSHELRTPLNAILGWSHLLERGSNEPEELQRGLSAIARNARAQTQLIEDLLDMSRILTGKFRLEVHRVNLSEVISAAIDSVLPGAQAKSIRIEPVLDTTLGGVLGDPARLQQAVWNLLSNAVKFTPKEGKIQVALQMVNSHVEVRVSDNGQGIAPEFLPHVFDRFRQAEQSATRRQGGLGLGLALVKQIAELHGGGVSVRSEGVGKGSTFTLHLPMALSEAHAGSSTTSPALDRCPDLKGVTVLVVDDQPDARLLAKRILEECGARILLAESAGDAILLLRQQHVDVIVSDIGMPEVDGFQFIQHVRSLPRDAGGVTPAAALTAFARPEDRRRALMAGYQSHVVKPVDPLELMTVVASLAGRTGNARGDGAA